MYNTRRVSGLDNGKTDTQIGFRTTMEFKARLEAQAKREHRGLSNLILKVLDEYLEEHEPKG